MNLYISLTVLYLTLCGCNVWCATTPHYTINLDLKPENRWKQVGEDYVTILKDFKDFLLKKFDISKKLLPIADTIGSDLDRYIPAPFSGELAGLAKYSKIPLSELVLANMVYELTAFCTSFVVQNETGLIMHGRNLDYSQAKELQKLVIDLDFQRNGTTVYSGTTFAGYIGLLTAQKPGVLTVTLNERNIGNAFENLIDLLIANHSFSALAVREMLDTPYQTFANAVNFLAYQTLLVAPCYFIIGGVKTLEGVVITRARLAALSVDRLDLESGKWFVLETNYDPWTTPPPSDDRRGPAIRMLDKIGRSIDIDTLYGVLNREPVCNSDTVYTTVMSAALPDLFSTHIRANDCS